MNTLVCVGTEKDVFARCHVVRLGPDAAAVYRRKELKRFIEVGGLKAVKSHCTHIFIPRKLRTHVFFIDSSTQNVGTVQLPPDAIFVVRDGDREEVAAMEKNERYMLARSIVVRIV